MCSSFDTIPACDRQTDGRTDGIAIASTALAMRALQCAVKTVTTASIQNKMERHKNMASNCTTTWQNNNCNKLIHGWKVKLIGEVKITCN